jgi:Polysaccharide deacetylase
MLEKNLGIQVKAFAYPYGLHNQTVRDVVKQAGYEVAFTVWGRRIAYGADPMIIGRYGIESTKPQVFEEAVNFKGAIEGSDDAGVMSAAAIMVIQPIDGETVSDSLPEIKSQPGDVWQCESQERHDADQRDRIGSGHLRS